MEKILSDDAANGAQRLRRSRLNIAVVGLGKRSLKRALPTIEQNNDKWNLVAVCDPDKAVRQTFETCHPQVPTFAAVSQMIEWQRKQDEGLSIECAYLAVPIHAYSEIIPLLLRSNIHILREKPAAKTLEEQDFLQGLAASQNVRLMTASQRRYGESLHRMKEWLPFIGKVHTIEGARKIVVTDLGVGWRARAVLSNGGAMGEIGWHLIDFILGLFQYDCAPAFTSANLFRVRAYQGYDAEDSGHAVFEITPPGEKSGRICSAITVSRLGPEKFDELIVTGEDGVLKATRDTVTLQTLLSSGELNMSMPIHRQLEVANMFEAFHQEILSQAPSKEYYKHSQLDRVVTQALEDIYTFAYTAGNKTVLATKDANSSLRGYQMTWPVISEETENTVQQQLHKDISIYDNGGVFRVFEDEFKELHGMPESYALLHNSGTNALHALYFAAGLKPGDEVIFPVYTFHATASPAMHFGVHPVFCDASEDGNISPSAIASAISSRTKAVILTHMWGQPCDMTSILAILSSIPHILLFEDCSHAHGGTFNGKPLGTFGDGAAWSLQGQKIITGGEGGIVLTKHADFHHRQLIWGHYNKRCKIEIPRDHELFPYCLTGAGLKNRSHPLAVAIALNMLRNLGVIHQCKMRFAAQMRAGLNHIPWLKMPPPVHLQHEYREPAWYAFVMRFDAIKAPKGLTREIFVQQLVQEGLLDVDIPKSTGLLHGEALFNEPEIIFPYLYPGGLSRQSRKKQYPTAQKFYNEAIKLPVHATPAGKAATEYHVRAINKVAQRWIDREDTATCFVDLQEPSE
ncbi:hypothetical protein QQS21_012548 [Conoideocrella luteorostrata]|uniref:Gfo/Idh/MocA-like oxidoreductase N-terminal domain-containing protein n=1 Tax=Conoideocrella luteorostrata TaxID=1105319 RepID=A0AAJ0CDQ3_9HYPO|nr:hypothetical protein QQS21_012548 [Conoideocrella luteorostrata]